MRTFAQKPKTIQQATHTKTTIPGRAHFEQSRDVNSILHLQRTIGNQAFLRLIQTNRGGIETSSSSAAGTHFSHDFSRIPICPAPQTIQTKLTVNKLGDKYEQEADRVAEQMMRMPDPASPAAVTNQAQSPHIQRFYPECEKELHRQPLEEVDEEETLQTKEILGRTPTVTPAVQSQVNAMRGSGKPLPKSTRTFFESRFGHDFSQVRTHVDARAEKRALAVGARAYKVGQHVVFGERRYAPGTTGGRRLLAHELAHVVQQNQHLGIQSSAHGAESEAGQASMRVAMGQPVLVHTTVKGGIQRQPISNKEVGRRTKAPAGVGVSHAWEVLDALKQQDPVGSPEYQDFKEAFRILNALWMPDLLITLTELRHSDTGLGQNYLELLISKTESFDVSDRLVTTMLVVMGSYYAGAIELKEHLSSSDRTDIADYLKRTQTGASEMHLRIIEDLREEPTTQPQPSQSWGNRVRTAQELLSEGVYSQEAIDAYVDLLAEALNIGPDEVHVAKSEKEYRPGVINFDPQPSEGKAAFVRHERMPLSTGDPVPEKPQLVLGPKSIVESSPLYTQATLTHEKTHESHWNLVVRLAKSWTSPGKHRFVKEWLEEHQKEISENEYHLINAFIDWESEQRMTPKKLEHRGVTEIMSNLEAFTSHYRRASEEKVKENLLEHNLTSMAYELDNLKGKAKGYYEETVRQRLREEYCACGEGHQRTFDSWLNDFARRTTSEGQRSLYARWAAEFRCELP